AVHLARQLGEHCGLIAEAGADFENHVVRLELEQIRHHRNHHGLRDRLIETDGNWPVQVSVLLNLDRHKLVSRHLGHCPEDSLVERGLAKLVGYVFGYRPDCRNHLSSLFLKKFHVHETLIEAPSERGGQLSSSIARFDTSGPNTRILAGAATETYIDHDSPGRPQVTRLTFFASLWTAGIGRALRAAHAIEAGWVRVAVSTSVNRPPRISIRAITCRATTRIPTEKKPRPRVN